MLPLLQKILEQNLCDSCIGRQFGQLLSGYTNSERGKFLRAFSATAIDARQLQTEKINPNNFFGFKFRQNEEFEKLIIGLQGVKHPACELCFNLFDNLEKLAKRISNSLSKYEFSSFVIGTNLSRKLLDSEEKLWERCGIDYCEPMRAELNRELGKRVEKITGKKADLKKPDIAVLLDMEANKVLLNVNPLFIFGYYQKLQRGFPQCKWGTPNKYKTSVEEQVGLPALKLTLGRDHKFHGCVVGETKILLNECSLPIAKLEDSWNKHEAVSFNEKEKRIEISQIKDFMKMKASVSKLRTKETGREIIATKEHPFFTPNGMALLANLDIGSRVAVNSLDALSYEEPKEIIIADERNIFEVVKKYAPTSYKKKILSELKERNLLPLKSNDLSSLTLARIIAFLFGDGNVRYTRKRDVGIEFYGEEKDLKEIQKDLKKLGFESKIYKKLLHTSITKDYYGKDRIIKSKIEQKVLVCYSKSLWALLVALGVPVGNKVVNEFKIPDWIKLSSSLKREFLSSLFACEMDVPRHDKRKYNRKSFNTPRFSLNKIESKLENLISFTKDIKEILSEFEIKTLELRLVPYTTRKDGNKSIKVMLDFNNNFENLINLYSRINFRYCRQKEVRSKYVLEYLLMKKYIVDKRKELFKKALGLKREGLQLSQIHKKLNSSLVSKKDLWLWISGNIKNKNIKVPNNFPNFDDWLKNCSEGLSDGLVWETVESIEEVGERNVFDMTIPKNHNFFANGFLVSNSGREDIDARCLAWRPFVLEITKPRARKIDLKKLEKLVAKGKKVKIKSLKVSSMETVREIKAAAVDKTYRALVQLKKSISKKDLKKLSALRGTISQRTPERVLHRRADLHRKREVISLKAKMKNPKTLELIIKGSAGLYIKELITGDNGRTRPSVSEVLGIEAVCKELDVVGIGKIKL